MPALPPPAIVRTAPCTARQIVLRIDGEDGAFDGMSHSGTRLLLRNAGRSACSVPGLPHLAFRRADGRVLPIVRKPPPGMHPGPMIAPVILAPGAVASTALRWVSGEVFDASRCLAPARLTVDTGGGTLRARFAGRLCGPAGAPVTFEQPPLAPGRPQP